MARVRFGGCIALLLLVGCGAEEGPSGPALEPRPETQTCIPDISAGMPERLSDTGCFSDLKSLEPGPDLIPYEVSSSLWTDGAFKPRYLVVPPDERIRVHEDGSWEFPEGSVLIKVFGFDMEVDGEVGPQAVEARFMVRAAGWWKYATYRWNEDGTDAELLTDGATVSYTVYENGQPVVVEYGFPAANDCTICHGMEIDDVLGPKTNQLNRDRNYDGFVENQIRAMDEIELLDFGTMDDPDPDLLPTMASPQLGRGRLDEQARAYLDANCAHCHRPGGWAPTDSELDLRYETPLAATGLCEPMRFFNWVGLPRIAPGDPDGSGLIDRVDRDDVLRMPSFGSAVVDPAGVELLRRWIRELRACP